MNFLEFLNYDFYPFHAMLISFANTFHLKVLHNFSVFFHVKICIGSLGLEVFRENCCFTHSVMSWLAGHAICRHGGKL